MYVSVYFNVNVFVIQSLELINNYIVTVIRVGIA